MEVIKAVTTVAKNMEFYVANPWLAYTDVNVKAYFHLHYLIFAGKSIVAGYASMFFVPMWITAAIFLACIVNTYIKSLDYFAHAVFQVVTTQLIYRNIKREFAKVLFWSFVQWDKLFQHFLDIYFVMVVILFLIQYFGEEHEKVSNLIAFLFIVDWTIDKFQGTSPLNINIITATFLLVALVIFGAKPLEINSNVPYEFVCVFFLACLSYKYCKIDAAHKLFAHFPNYPSRNWIDEMLDEKLDEIQVYVYNVMKYVNLYEPAKYVSICIQEFVKRTLEIIPVELKSNASALARATL